MQQTKTMVSHCANPACSIPLRYLRDGRLFQFEVRPVVANGDSAIAHLKPGRRVWHYWLCGECAGELTLTFDGKTGLRVVPIADSYTHLLAAGMPMKPSPQL